VEIDPGKLTVGHGVRGEFGEGGRSAVQWRWQLEKLDGFFFVVFR